MEDIVADYKNTGIRLIDKLVHKHMKEHERFTAGAIRGKRSLDRAFDRAERDLKAEADQAKKQKTNDVDSIMSQQHEALQRALKHVEVALD